LDAFAVVEEYELADELDAAEWARLPQYLLSLGICSTVEDAKNKIQNW